MWSEFVDICARGVSLTDGVQLQAIKHAKAKEYRIALTQLTWRE